MGDNALRLSASGYRFALVAPPDYIDSLSWSLQDIRDDGTTWESTNEQDVWTLSKEAADVVLRARGHEVTLRPDKASVVRGVVTLLNSVARDVDDAALFVHCAGVAVGQAGVIAVGFSGVGKSTLTTALLAAGATYLSDECVSVTTDPVEFRGFPKPLSIKRGSRDVAAKFLSSPPVDDNWQLPASSLGGIWTGPISPRLVVFYSYDADLDVEVEIEEMDRADALVALLESTIDFSGREEVGFHCAAELVRQSTCFSMRTRDVQSAAERIMTIDLTTTAHGELAAVDPSTSGATAGPVRADATRSVVLDGRAVVLDLRPDALGIHEVVALDAAASVWWQLLDGTSLEDSSFELHNVLDSSEAAILSGGKKILLQLEELGLVDGWTAAGV